MDWLVRWGRRVHELGLGCEEGKEVGGGLIEEKVNKRLFQSVHLKVLRPEKDGYLAISNDSLFILQNPKILWTLTQSGGMIIISVDLRLLAVISGVPNHNPYTTTSPSMPR